MKTRKNITFAFLCLLFVSLCSFMSLQANDCPVIDTYSFTQVDGTDYVLFDTDADQVRIEIVHPSFDNPFIYEGPTPILISSEWFSPVPPDQIYLTRICVDSDTGEATYSDALKVVESLIVANDPNLDPCEDADSDEGSNHGATPPLCEDHMQGTCELASPPATVYISFHAVHVPTTCLCDELFPADSNVSPAFTWSDMQADASLLNDCLPNTDEDKRKADLNNSHLLATIELFPNPINDVLHLRWSEDGNYTVSIVSSQGRLLKRTQLEGMDAKIDLEDLQPGIYIVSVRNSADIIANTRVLKQ